MKRFKRFLIPWLAACCLALSACALDPAGGTSLGGTETASQGTGGVTVEEVLPYSGTPYAVINQNEPEFTDDELTDQSFEEYSRLDELNRCQTAVASIGRDLMPTEERGSISQVKPTGWHSVRYDNVEGGNLYNRCHLIGYQLTGENANEENLITGTRYLNVEGMLPFENMVADYVKETGNHVLYRVTPVFEGDNLVASGVEMEAESVEDDGEGICFHVYCYNVQPGVEIDYRTGESRLAEDASESTGQAAAEETYILNTNTHKFHNPNCSSVEKMDAANRKEVRETREAILGQGYEPCGICKP